jgi:hypothetical protein
MVDVDHELTVTVTVVNHSHFVVAKGADVSEAAILSLWSPCDAVPSPGHGAAEQVQAASFGKGACSSPSRQYSDDIGCHSWRTGVSFPGH